MSRLQNNSVQIRDFLESRNLYTPNDPYNISGTETSNVINNIASVVNPFGTTITTVADRIVNGQTALTQIGLEMLAKQFAYNAASNAAAEYLPAIKFENLFDGDPDTKLLMKKEDFQITRRESQGNVGKILEEISGNNPTKGYPFTKDTTNIDIIKNSGKGQLQLFYKEISKNLYQPSSRQFVDLSISEGFNYGMNIEVQFNNKFFIGRDEVFNPFNQYKTTADISALNSKLYQEKITFINQNQDSNGYLEYGANQVFVDGMGKTDLNNNTIDFIFNSQFVNTDIYNLDGNGYGLDDDPRNQLVWGRDTDNNSYKDEVGGFDNPVDGVQPSESGGVTAKLDRFANISEINRFNIRNGGLLSYTRELLNSKGRNSSFDLTRKKFQDTDENVHFNGSPLSLRLDGKTDKNRQHSVLDPYNAFVKTIRFNGNKIYNGNPRSVIYNSVIPQITPNTVNKDLMFSIENLAIEVNGDEDTAVMDDGTVIPLCERGPNNGRFMWFPPYDIKISENIAVSRETTTFIGRGEPIYTYNNTERMANLSFKLIIDYPPNIEGLNHVEASRFFAFGGAAPLETSNVSEKEKKRDDLIKQRDKIKKTKDMRDPDLPFGRLNFFFANDQPRPNGQWNVQTHIDKGYELGTNIDGNNFDYNQPFVDNIDAKIQELLINETGDVSNSKYVSIYIESTASVLFNANNGDDYNQKLSQRRADAIRDYVEQRYTVLSGGRTLDQADVSIRAEGKGQTGGGATDDADEIPTQEAKQARSGFVDFFHNLKQVEVEVDITVTEEQDKKTLTADIEALTKEISKQKLGTYQSGCDFNPYTIEDGVIKGFEASQKGKYKPAFHSQTPEDFHRRLTFLQQCTRQGQAVRKERGGEGENTFSANNAVFGRQPVQILRIGDMFHTKIFIDNLQIDYSESPWDMNPEGMGMQFMIADVKMQLKLVGGQSLKGPINALQNALSFNYYANSTFYNTGVYAEATKMESLQYPPDDNPAETTPKTVETQRVTEIPSLSTNNPTN